ncbi:hypothetical protein GCM10027586_20280 [Kineococcus gypseus]|uniref:DUF4245 domain-containing protein n=1 Tax=Kineococcus gypseus TaxID=1637102 RepID=UPI003D7EDC96
MSPTGPTPVPGAPAPTGEDPRGVPRTRRGGNVQSMVVSMAVILGIVALVVWVVPRPSSVQQPPADVPNAAAGAAQRLSFLPPVPRVPQGWTATSAQLNRSTDGVLTWHVGYRTAQGEYLALEAARDVTPAWVRAQTAGGGEDGTADVDGRSWERRLQEDRDRHSLVRTQDGVTVVATGEAGYPVITELVRATEAGWAAAGSTWGSPPA